MWYSNCGRNFVDKLEIVPGVAKADIAGTGYVWRKTNTGALPNVRDMFDPVNGTRTIAPAFASKCGITLIGLMRGMDYCVRVRAVSTGADRGPWSEIADATAM